MPKAADPKALPPIDAFIPQEELRDICVNLYDGDIAFADFHFGRLIEDLKESSQYDNTVIVLTSDHGEELWDHGDVYHGHTLYEELLRIPLLVKLTQSCHAGEQRTSIINGIDLAPTLLDFVNAPPEKRFQGTTFLPLIRSRMPEDRLGYASLQSIKYGRDQRTAKDLDLKLYEKLEAGSRVWFDLKNDAEEQRPLRQAPASSERLLRKIHEVGLLRPTGLQVLITGVLTEEPLIQGTIECADLGEVELIYPEENSKLVRDGHRVDFQIRIRQIGHRASFQQSYQAQLCFELPESAEPRLTVTVNGNPIDPATVFLGPQRTNSPLENTLLKLGDLAVPADFITRVDLSPQNALYAWYVRRAATLREEDLDPETLDNLRALGYLEQLATTGRARAAYKAPPWHRLVLLEPF